MAVGDLLGSVAGATPYGAALGAVTSLGSSVASALTPPPNYSTTASNKKQDQFLIQTIAPQLDLQITTGGAAGGQTSSASTTPTITAATEQHAEATGGQGNTSPIGAGAASLFSDPIFLIGAGVVALFVVLLIFRKS